jgi:AcrR family transcriptional regulator
MPASERRAEIVAATLPLVLQHGAAVTTRQIAEAAGVAEGTIFRVFPDKESLIEAVVEAAFDMQAVDEALEGIDVGLPFEERLIAAVDVLRRRVAQIMQLRTAVEMLPPAAAQRMALRHHTPDLSGLAALLEPDRDQLRHHPLQAAFLLRGLTIVGTHPTLILDEPLSSAEIVSLFLDGARARPSAPPESREGPCC